MKLLGGEFIWHGAQQNAKNTVIDSKFPGFEKARNRLSWTKNGIRSKTSRPDIHVLTVIDAPAMKGDEYKRPAYPTTWARQKAKAALVLGTWAIAKRSGRNPLFQDILVGGIAGLWVKPLPTSRLTSKPPRPMPRSTHFIQNRSPHLSRSDLRTA